MNRITFFTTNPQRPLKAFLYAPIVIILILLTSCSGNENASEEDGIIPDAGTREISWTTKNELDNDIAMKFGETVLFEGYLLKIIENEKELFVEVGPRHNSAKNGGKITVNVTGHPQIKNYEKIHTIRSSNQYDSTKFENWNIYLTNGDTLTDEYMNRSKVWIQGKSIRKIDKDTRFKYWTLSLDSISKIASTIEKDYEIAIPLTPAVSEQKGSTDDSYVYTYVQGYFEVPYSVPAGGSNSYSLAFISNKSFYRLILVPVLIADHQAAHVAPLANDFTNIKIWDSNLDIFKSETEVRLYGLWRENSSDDFEIEDIVVIEKDSSMPSIELE